MDNDKGYKNHVQSVLKAHGIAPMELVRKCGVSVGTAYKAIHGEHLTIETTLVIYRGLRVAGYPVEWDDFITIDHPEPQTEAARESLYEVTGA